MTWDSPDGTITTEAELEVALTQLLASAHENGLTVTKPWLCRTDDGYPDWEATIVELDESATDD